MWNPSLGVFEDFRFFPIVSVKILQGIVLHREKISVVFRFSVCFNSSIAFTSSLFGLIPVSSISCPSRLVLFRKSSDFLSLARYPAFSNFFSTSNYFLCSLRSPRVTTVVTPCHAGVEYSNVRSIFSWKIVGMSARP